MSFLILTPQELRDCEMCGFIVLLLFIILCILALRDVPKEMD